MNASTPAAEATGKEFPLFELEGSVNDIGTQYGRLAAEYIRRSIEIYKNGFAQKSVPWEQAIRVAHEFMPQIERYDADFLREIEAIAAGAELPVEHIVAINARTELLYGQAPQTANAPDTDPDGCTGAMAMPEATADGHVLHGQNWDWRDECAESSVVLKVRPVDGPDMLIFVEAGILARCGLNSAGVAVTGNFLQTDNDFGKAGVPAPLIRRRILKSRSLSEAIRVVFQAPRAFSNNLMISQSDGECVNLEGTPGEVFWLQPDNGLLVHANHFVSPGALAKVHDYGLETNSDSLYRHRRVQASLAARAGALTPADLINAFADRYGSPRAVCRSPISGPGGKTSSTVATVVMDTSARRMWIARQPYREHHFREYVLDA